MLALDHIVIAENDVVKACSQYESQFTIKASKGGEHTNWGTHNYLAYFSNSSYLEWLGIKDMSIAEKSNNPLIEHLVYVLQAGQTGPFQFALRTDRMDDYVKHFKESSIPYQGPFAGERQKPDGSILKWRMLFPTYDYTVEMLPFLIEWENPDQIYGVNPANPQAITNVQYRGTTIERFAHIYQIKPQEQFSLKNAKINFNSEKELSFTLT